MVFAHQADAERAKGPTPKTCGALTGERDHRRRYDIVVENHLCGY
jgi:hypothetical protein